MSTQMKAALNKLSINVRSTYVSEFMSRESLHVTISTELNIAIFYSLLDPHTSEDVSYPTNKIFAQAA